jgi:hypothetical protein
MTPNAEGRLVFDVVAGRPLTELERMAEPASEPLHRHCRQAQNRTCVRITPDLDAGR